MSLIFVGETWLLQSVDHREINFFHPVHCSPQFPPGKEKKKVIKAQKEIFILAS